MLLLMSWQMIWRKFSFLNQETSFNFFQQLNPLISLVREATSNRPRAHSLKGRSVPFYRGNIFSVLLAQSKCHGDSPASPQHNNNACVIFFLPWGFSNVIFQLWQCTEVPNPELCSFTRDKNAVLYSLHDRIVSKITGPFPWKLMVLHYICSFCTF